MTDSTITINAGPPQQIGANLAQGYTIRNQSTTTGLWIRGDPTVAIGNGQKLGALGSILWNGGPCYAALDSTTGSATVSLSTNTQQVNDPVAIAQAINAQGVPNVLQQTELYNAHAISNNPTFNQNLGQIALNTVGSYATLSIRFDNFIGPVGYKIQFLDALGNETYRIRYPDVNPSVSFEIDVPIHGPQCIISWTNTANNPVPVVGLIVTASNRQLPEKVTGQSDCSSVDKYNVSSFTWSSQAWAAFQTVVHPFPFYTTGGPHWIITDQSSTTLKFRMNLVTVDPNTGNGSQAYQLVDTSLGGMGYAGAPAYQGMVNIPPGNHQFSLTNGTATGTSNFFFTIYRPVG